MFFNLKKQIKQTYDELIDLKRQVVSMKVDIEALEQRFKRKIKPKAPKETGGSEPLTGLITKSGNIYKPDKS